MFQFPSNGKAYLNTTAVMAADDNEIEVSIPFKRESISELSQVTILQHKDLLVSIPFKRESISELLSFTLMLKKNGIMFQFPSNGKAYLNSRSSRVRISLATANTVSIPFKRESISEHRQRQSQRRAPPLVSIPFKRESISERRS